MSNFEHGLTPQTRKMWAERDILRDACNSVFMPFVLPPAELMPVIEAQERITEKRKRSPKRLVAKKNKRKLKK